MVWVSPTWTTFGLALLIALANVWYIVDSWRTRRAVTDEAMRFRLDQQDKEIARLHHLASEQMGLIQACIGRVTEHLAETRGAREERERLQEGSPSRD